MKLFLILAVAASLSIPALCRPVAQAVGPVPSAGEELKALPPINLQDFDGNAVPSDRFKGSVLVLDFWATWCVPCLAEIPTFNRLQEKYKDQGLRVVGVALASGEPKEVKPFIGKNKMKYTVLMGDDDQVYDLNVIGFPTTYLVTRDMKVFRKYIGSGPRKAAQIEADIQKLLAVK